MVQPRGIDVASVTRWFVENIPEASPPLSFDVISGGRSNLTYEVTDEDGRSYVFRRPPLHGVLPSAHDVIREFRFIDALSQSSVPVPVARGYNAGDVNEGAPFFVMNFVPGHVIRNHEDGDVLSVTARQTASESLIDCLVALHDVDASSVGLNKLATQDDYVARQLRRWISQYERGSTNGMSLVREVHDRLADRIPPQRHSGIVHGDYRLDNVIVGDDGRVQVVLDWELSTLGDPLADLGLLRIYWTEPGDMIIPTLSSPTDRPGWMTREEMASRYERASGRSLGPIAFYEAFGLWKLAVILQGVDERHAADAYEQTDIEYHALGDSVPDLLERSRELLVS